MKRTSKGAPRASGKSSTGSRDPHYERERDRYEHPIASREFILDTLLEHGAPVADGELERLLGIPAEDSVVFRRRIGAMLRDGQIMRNRRNDICVAEKLDLVRGTVQGHRDGFGFLLREDGGPDLFLGPAEMHKAMHGDRVMARPSGVDRRGRPEGKIVEVLERAQQRVVGRLRSEHGVLYVVPEDSRLNRDFLIPPDAVGAAQPGQVVTVEVMVQPTQHSQPVGRIVEVLGTYADPGMEIEIALRKHRLPHLFPPAAERLAAGFADEISAAEQAGRVDIRDLPLVTIDSETARDFDDAVYCEPLAAKRGRTDTGFRLLVAIADVSHYVRQGDTLDREAHERGNSVYFPRRVIPMLPERLSNGLCSINPGVDRLAMVCDLQVDARGEIVSYRFYQAVMRSHARLTYNLVAQMLEQPQGEAARQHAAVLPHVVHLERLYQMLAKARARRGAIDFETIETEMLFNAQGKVERIVPVFRNDAHRIIEECMLAANVCASDFLREHEHPMLYRIHAGPAPEKLEGLREFLKGFGLSLAGGESPHARDYAKLLEKVRTRPDVQLLQTVMLRSLKQAVYSPDNVGHFGLAYESYTHFTSPIRRYPDLLVHRAIKASLAGRRYEPGDWHALGVHCSAMERRADEATRDVVAWLKCYYMQDRVGEAFPGTISGVAAFGVFVALDEVYVEGLLHVSELGQDYFHYDAARHQMLGERTSKRYRLGDRLRVKLVRVDLDTTRIEFQLAD